MATPNNRDISVRLRVRDDGSVVLAGFGRQVERTARRSERNFRRIDTASRRTAKGVRDFAGSLGLLGGVTGAAIGVAALVLPIAKAAQVTDRLQVALAGVRAVSGATADDMARLEEQARRLGSTTQFSASQAAEAQEFLAKAGFQVNEVLGATPATLDLAAAGMLDLGRAADISSNVLQAFEGEAEELQNIVDIMAATASNANTNVEQMGKAMEYVAPVANSFGISIEETAAGIAVLSNAGFQAEKAGTGLRRVLVDLANPSGKLAAVMGGLTVESDGLVAVMERVANSTLSAQDAMDIFGQRGGPAFNILRAGASSAAEFAEMLQDVDGVARKIAETRLDNLSGDARKLASAFAELGIQVGKSGLIEDLRDLTQSLTEFGRGDTASAIAQNLFPALKGILGVLASLAAARFGGPALAAMGRGAATAAAGVTTLNASLTTLAGRAALVSKAGGGLAALTAGLGGLPGLAILAGIGIYQLATRETELAKASEEAADAQKQLNEEMESTKGASLNAVIEAKKATETLVQTLRSEIRSTERETGVLPEGMVEELEEAEEKVEDLAEQLRKTHPGLDAFGGAGEFIENAWAGAADEIVGAESAMERLEASTKRLNERQENAVQDARDFAAAQREILKAQFEARAPDLDDSEQIRQREELNDELQRLERAQFEEERRIAAKTASERLFLLKANISDEEQLLAGKLAIRRDLAEQELAIERKKFAAIKDELIDALGEEQRLRRAAAKAGQAADEMFKPKRIESENDVKIRLMEEAKEAERNGEAVDKLIDKYLKYREVAGDSIFLQQKLRELQERATEEAGKQAKSKADELDSSKEAIGAFEEQIRDLSKERDLQTNVKVDTSEFDAFLRRIANPGQYEVEVRAAPGPHSGQARQDGGPIFKAATGRRVPGGYGGGDRVRAMLEPGEYVIRKEAARHYGPALMSALNSMRLPPPIYRAAGGPVGEIMRRTKFPSQGGRDQVDINLTAGGERISGAADRELADGLARVLRGMSSSVPGGVG